MALNLNDLCILYAMQGVSHLSGKIIEIACVMTDPQSPPWT